MVLSDLQKDYTRDSWKLSKNQLTDHLSYVFFPLSKETLPSFKKRGNTFTSTQIYNALPGGVINSRASKKGTSQKNIWGSFYNDNWGVTDYPLYSLLSFSVLHIFPTVQNGIFWPLTGLSKFWYSIVHGQLRAVSFKELCLFYLHTLHLHTVLSKNASLFGRI